MQTTLKNAAAALLVGAASQAGAASTADTEPSFYQKYMFADVIADQSRKAVDGIEDASRNLYGTTVDAAASLYEPVGKTVKDLSEWKSVEASVADERFRELSRRMGFELMSVNVGFDLLPHFELSFERRVPASHEDVDLETHIQEHIADQPLLTSFDERIVFSLLRHVAKNERYQRVQEIEISLLPLPGIELAYDVHGKLAEEKAMIETSHEKVIDLEEKFDELERELEEYMLKFDGGSASLVTAE